MDGPSQQPIALSAGNEGTVCAGCCIFPRVWEGGYGPLRNRLWTASTWSSWQDLNLRPL